MTWGAVSNLRVGFLGRIPPPLGGGGMELQMDRTAAALERLGHDVVQVEAAGPDDGFDLLHAFGSEPAVWHHLRHWTRNRTSLVVTSVVVVSPGREERALRLSARLPGILTSSRMRAQLLREADAVIAGTEYERRLALRLGAREVEVIGNGADTATDDGPAPGGLPPPGYVLLLGAVTTRKRQLEVVRVLAGHVPVVVAGHFVGSEHERQAWEAAVAAPGVEWLGHVGDPDVVAALQRDASALVHLSSAEVESLAVLETLARSTPAVLSDIPSHRALAGRNPGWVETVRDAAEVPEAVTRAVASNPSVPPDIPSWDEVAERLAAVYARMRSRAT